MKAVVFPAANEVVLSDLPDPVPGRGEAVIAVRASGICHTDIEVLRGNYGTSAFPVVPGHEYAGEVLEVGEDVEGASHRRPGRCRSEHRMRDLPGLPAGMGSSLREP